jgi:hypothetical protein
MLSDCRHAGRHLAPVPELGDPLGHPAPAAARTRRAARYSCWISATVSAAVPSVAKASTKRWRAWAMHPISTTCPL